MQNVQRLKGSGGTSKYLCKYIAKIDEQNYCVIEVDGQSRLVSKATFLHNTKVTSSKIAEDEKRQKDNNKPQGHCITLMEMLHLMLRYPEVYTNIEFIKVTTMSLQFCAGIQLNPRNTQDAAYVGSAIDDYRNCPELDFDDWRQHTPSQNLMLDDLKLNTVSVDKVTQFGL